MWGQGLRRQDRFAALIVEGLKTQLNATVGLVYDKSRSGATIVATRSAREAFARTYPALFTRASRARFEENGGADSGPASALYGEVPATFPTVQGQLAMFADATAQQVDVALLDGGVNDIGIPDIIDPRAASGEFIARFEGAIRAIAYDAVLNLIEITRRKCPNAVIMYFGFFPPLSYTSNTSKIRDFFKREFDNDLKWFLNEHVYTVTDVDALIHEAVVRGVWFHGLWQYWTLKAVDDANHDDNIRGPGILYVPSAFAPDNAVYAPTPWLWDDPDPPTTDPARVERERSIPRRGQLDNLVRLRAVLAQIRHVLNVRRTVGGLNTQAPPDPTQLVNTIASAIDGPEDLQSAIRAFRARPDIDETEALLRAVQAEIDLIRHGMIASTSHPNVAGARSYADNALARHDTLIARRAQAQAEQLRPPVTNPAAAGETLDQLLRRCNMRSDGPIDADLGRIDIDSFRLRIVTTATSAQNMLPDVYLVVQTRHAGAMRQRNFQVNFKYRPEIIPRVNGAPITVVHKLYPHFEPGTTHRFTVPTVGQFQLDEIVSTHLGVSQVPPAFRGIRGYATEWTPERVQVEVNGVPVIDIAVSSTTLKPGDWLDLHWPAPAATFQPPVLESTTLKPVRALGIFPAKPDVTIGAPARKRPAKATAAAKRPAKRPAKATAAAKRPAKRPAKATAAAKRPAKRPAKATAAAKTGAGRRSTT